jgi:hypothetical protein
MAIAVQTVNTVLFHVLVQATFCLLCRQYLTMPPDTQVSYFGLDVDWTSCSLFRRLATGCSQSVLLFCPRSVHVGCVLEKLKMAQIFSLYSRIPLSVIPFVLQIHHHHHHHHHHHLSATDALLSRSEIFKLFIAVWNSCRLCVL